LRDVGRNRWQGGASSHDVARLGAARLDDEKKTLYASEQDPVAREQWRTEVQALPAEQFVFVDESSTGLNLTRRYARTPRGEQAYGYIPRNYGTRTTLIAALSPTGMGAAMILAGAVDTVAFEAYIEQCLVPELRPGQIVLMDNLSSHKSAAIQAAIEGAGCRLLFLPAYSPDYSPIEPALSKIKASLRRSAARTQEALDQAIADALEAVTAQDAHGWFAYCGYELPVAI
jgi:transposase